MNAEQKERLRRAHAHLRAAKKYAAKGNASKARAHFGRAEHYGSEFGGFMDAMNLIGSTASWALGYPSTPATVDDLKIQKSSFVDYTCKDPEEPGSMWLCQQCKCVDVVIYAENSGDRCVAPGCKGTRKKAQYHYNMYNYVYEGIYKTMSMPENKLRVNHHGTLKPDQPEVTVPPIATGAEPTQVPDPTKIYSLWICQEFDHNQYACNTIRLLWRVPNKEDFCANPMCAGVRSEAVSAYGMTKEEYISKFNEAVGAARRVVKYNKPLPRSVEEKRQALGLTAPEIGAKHAVALKEANEQSVDKQRDASYIEHRLIDSLDDSHHAVVIACLDELRNRPELPAAQFHPRDNAKTKELLKVLAGKYNETKKVDLGSVTSTDMTELLKMFIPRLVVDCVDELRRRHEGHGKNYPEGLFRIQGNVNKTKELFSAYKENKIVDLRSASSDDITGLLKKFFSQLQTPLMGECIAPTDPLELRKLPGPREPDQQTETPTKKEPLPVGHKLVLLYMLPLLRAIAKDPSSNLNETNLSRVLVVMTNKSEHLYHIQDNRPLAQAESGTTPAQLAQIAQLSRLQIMQQAAAEEQKCISFITRVIFHEKEIEAILRSNP